MKEKRGTPKRPREWREKEKRGTPKGSKGCRNQGLSEKNNADATGIKRTQKKIEGP